MRVVIFKRTLILIAALAGTIVPMALTSALVRGQSAPGPSFEVASIKVHPPDPSGQISWGLGGPDVSRFTATDVTVKMLITFAYDIENFQVLGGPGWIDSNRYDVDAKVEADLVDQLRRLPESQQMDRMRPMLRALLADRFKLSVTEGTKELPVFALVVAKGGSKLIASAPPTPADPSAPPPAPLPPPGPEGPPPPTPGNFSMFVGGNRQAILSGTSVSLSHLVDVLSQQLRREILDRTGLKGTYTFRLSWTPQQGMLGAPLPAGDDIAADTGESIFTALQEQLGLKLEDTKAPVETVAIDHIEEPSPN